MPILPDLASRHLTKAKLGNVMQSLQQLHCLLAYHCLLALLFCGRVNRRTTRYQSTRGGSPLQSTVPYVTSSNYGTLMLMCCPV